MTLSLGFTSCNNDDDGYYVSISGDGTLTIDYNLPIYLYRMIYFGSEESQEVYIMGGTSYISSDEEFGGRGASIKFTLPNPDDDKLLEEQTFEIDNATYIVEYSPYINYDNSNDNADFTALTSGTVIIRHSGELYDVKVLGTDTDGDNVIIAYRGYLYRSFWVEGDE